MSKETTTKAIKTTAAVEAESVSIVPAQERENVSIESMLNRAIDKGVPVETMERLLVMRRDLKAEHAKEAFTSAMSRFQSECPLIDKTKSVVNNGKLLYKYAPIESIVSQVKEPLRNNGFSYSTNMKLLPDDEGVSVVVKVTHNLGHSEETEMTVPFGTKTGIMSQSQVAAAATTFAKRYAFLNAFGILTGDEDNDGADVTTNKASNPVSAVSDEMLFAAQERLEACTDVEELKRVWSDFPRSIKEKLEDAKNAKKVELGKTIV